MNELPDFDYIRHLYEKEDLHDVFATVLNTFPNITGATVQGRTYLWEILQRIKYNMAENEYFEMLFTHKYISGSRNPDYEEKKRHFPAVCYNAVFNDYKNIDHLDSITNLMFLDVDDFGSEEETLAYKKHITEKYDWIVACNLSLSRIGLHVIILVDKITGNEDHNRKYEYISATYFDGLLDPRSKSLSRYTVIPFDYNIYINESPKVLEIDSIINRNGKGISSAYNKESIDEKGISSVHIEEEIICTPYTFSFLSPLNQLMNDAARKHSLRFRQEVDESIFTNPDIPIYVSEGIDVIEVNLFPLRDRKIREGYRTSFIGALTVRMIYLNNESPEHINPDIRTDILKFILHINSTVCDPPLSHKEVLNSYNANWKKYIAGELDFSNYFIKQRAFWSKYTNLKGNEKRKVTCRIKNEPIVAESKRRIKEAVETINSMGGKITQRKVAKVSGLGLSTVKSYREYYWQIVQNYKSSAQNEKVISPTIEVIPSHQDDAIIVPEFVNQDESINTKNFNTSINDPIQPFDIENVEIITFQENISLSDNKEATLSDEHLHKVFDRVYECFKTKLDENAEKILYTRFLNVFTQLPKDDARLLATPSENINDGSAYWKQCSLESKFWNLCEGLL